LTNAHIVLIDETGLLLDPLVRRSRARRGQTPVYPTQGAHREKVSAIAALSVAPDGRLGRHFRALANGYFRNLEVADFLEGVLQRLGGQVLAVWDGGTMHQGAPLRALQQRYPGLTLWRLPPYAPDLNPVEQLWNYIKWPTSWPAVPVTWRRC
jgi:putative transposase